MKCLHCGDDLRWNNDYDTEDDEEYLIVNPLAYVDYIKNKIELEKQNIEEAKKDSIYFKYEDDTVKYEDDTVKYLI